MFHIFGKLIISEHGIVSLFGSPLDKLKIEGMFIFLVTKTKTQQSYSKN